MDKENAPYVHLLVFRCDNCRKPILITVMSEERNLEMVDGQAFDVLCRCGCLKRALGMEAVVHKVAPWEMRPSADDSTETPQTHSDI
jgi:hypothetical protein